MHPVILIQLYTHISVCVLSVRGLSAHRLAKDFLPQKKESSLHDDICINIEHL